LTACRGCVKNESFSPKRREVLAFNPCHPTMLQKVE
jgi:hypothetical protein